MKYLGLIAFLILFSINSSMACESYKIETTYDKVLHMDKELDLIYKSVDRTDRIVYEMLEILNEIKENQ